MNIEIIKDEQISTETTDFYFVKVNGETVLECLNESELKQVTIGDILRFYNEEE